MMGDRGSVSVPLVAGTLLFCLMALAVADLGSMLHARARAQAAADAAALAAVVNQVEILGHDDDPVAVAHDVAQRNGATVLSCHCERPTLWARVVVEVEPELVLLTGWMGRHVSASATAQADEAILSYRDG